jgi:hypothetical protein
LSDPNNKLGNYTVVTNNGTLTVTNAILTVAENSASRVYGATNPPLTGSVSGLRAGDDITAAFSSAAGTNSPVGVYPITFALADPGTRLGNYLVVTNHGTLTVTAAPLLVKADNTNKLYRTVLSFTGREFTLLNGALLNGNTLTNVSLSSPGTPKGAKVGNYPITASSAQGLGLTNYSITYSNGTLAVSPASLTITANNATKPYGTSLSFPLNGYAVSDLEPGDSVTNVLLNTTGADGTAPAADYDIVPSNAEGVGLTNYTIAYSNGTLTVSAANLAITALNTNKVYGATLNPASYTVSGLLNSDSVTNVTLTSAGGVSNAPVGPHPIIASLASGAGMTNYLIAYSNGTLTVGPATLQATADNKSRAYGQPNPAFTISYSGFVNGDSEVDLDALPVAATLATNTSAPGGYPITLGGGTDNNYQFNLANGTLTVTPSGPITITAVELTDPDHLRIAGTGDSNVTYRIQASTDLVSWTEIGTATADGTGAFEFVDAAAGTFSGRCYRVATP